MDFGHVWTIDFLAGRNAPFATGALGGVENARFELSVPGVVHNSRNNAMIMLPCYYLLVTKHVI